MMYEKINHCKSDRYGVTILGRYRSGSSGPQQISILDLSETECQIFEKRPSLEIGKEIRLWMQALGPYDATVVWVRDETIGLSFATPMYGPIFDHIRREFDNPEWRPAS